jgi:hypothetical protein
MKANNSRMRRLNREAVPQRSPGSRVFERTLGYNGPNHNLPRRGLTTEGRECHNR